MKILLASDCHGDTGKLETLEKMYPNMDYYFDLGDSNSISAFLGKFATVKGNGDYFSHCPDFRNITIEKLNILLTHKAQIYLDKNVNIFIHGHTHIPEIKLINKQLIICPGSLTYPRSSYGETYGILEIADKKLLITIKQFDTNKTLIEHGYNIEGTSILEQENIH